MKIPSRRLNFLWIVVAIILGIAVTFGFLDRQASAEAWNGSLRALNQLMQWTQSNQSALLGATLISLPLILFAFIALWAVKRLLLLRAKSFAPADALLPDSPINSTSEDQFDYNSIAEKLEKYICLAATSPSLVIALNDRWGAGKTSTLNLLKIKLSDHRARPILVEFSPWLVGTKESLIQNFLNQFAASIDCEGSTESESDVREACSKLLTMAEHLPGVGDWATAGRGFLGINDRMAGTTSETTLAEHKTQVSRSLMRLRRPIIVFVDDIDRLTPDEVLTTMQMVKAVCDFPGVCYLLALDQFRVAEKIRSLCGGDGFDYLEKIIQAEVGLPPTTFKRRQIHLKNLVLEAIRINNVELRHRDDIALDDALWLLSRTITTPRDATRFINRLILSNIHKKIFLPDRLIYEGLAMKYPAITSEIKRFPAKFSSIDIPSAALGLTLDEQIAGYTENKSSNNNEKYLENLLSNVSLENRDTVSRSLTFLFPRFNSSNLSRASHEASARLNDRAAHYPTLLNLIDVSDGNMNFSSQDATLFLNAPDQRPAILATHVLENRQDDFLIYLKTFIQEYGVRDPETMAKGLLSFGSIAFREHKLDLSRDVASLILTLFISKRPLEQPESFLRQLMSSGEFLSATEAIAVELARESQLWESGTYAPPTSDAIGPRAYGLSQKQIAAGINIWISAVENEALNRSFFFSEPEPISILYRWGQFREDFTSVRKYVDQLLQSPTGVEAFLACYDDAASVKNIEDLTTNLPYLLEQARQLKEKFPRTFRKLAEYVPAYLEESIKEK